MSREYRLRTSVAGQDHHQTYRFHRPRRREPARVVHRTEPVRPAQGLSHARIGRLLRAGRDDGPPQRDARRTEEWPENGTEIVVTDLPCWDTTRERWSLFRYATDRLNGDR